MLTYKGYTAQIGVDLDSGTIYGKILDIKDIITFEGITVDEVKQEFYKSVDVYLALCKDLGQEPDKAFSGKMPFRTTPSIHRQIYLAAAQAEKSINAWMEEVLIEATRQANNTSSTHRTQSTSAQSASSLQTYEQEQLLANMEEKIRQLRQSVMPYLKSGDSDTFDRFLIAIEPFLKDTEFVEIIQRTSSIVS